MYHPSLQILSLLSLLHHVLQTKAQTTDPLRHIDPLIGSTNGGNVFPGATRPYAMAKPGPDVTGQNTGGFSTDGSPITGFSSMHDSGTGGNPSLGNFPLFPQYCPDDDLNRCKFPKLARATGYKKEAVVAEVGYFAVEMEGGIRAEMTAGEKTALYRFTFPERTRGSDNQTALHPLLMVDLTDLWDSRQNASFVIDAANHHRIIGNGTFLPSFGAGSYMLHFCLDFGTAGGGGGGAKVFDSGVYVNDRAGTDAQKLFMTRGFNLFYLQAGGFVRFERPVNGILMARMGLSFVSSAQACQNAERELPGPEYDFEGTKATVKDAWREKLGGIQVVDGGASVDMQKTFWSGIYRTMISPQDYTGENPLWESEEPYFDSFYCIWDSFRAQHPLLTIIDPTAQSRMLRSLLDTYKHLGWLPDCRMSLCKGWTQGGSNADVLFTDAFVKNISGIDWNLAYEALVNNAENEPLAWSNEGRGGLMSWKRLGYIPYLDFDYLGFGTNSRSISRTVEYAYNDFCVAKLAQGIGKDEGAVDKYLGRSGNWKNLFKKDQRSAINGVDTGFEGFFQPKYLNGTWGYQDPILCSPLSSFCSLTSNPSETFESSVWEYQFYVPHDAAALIDTLGGPNPFLDRLSFAFRSGLLDISNEPVFLTVFLPHYAGRPALSTQRVHSYIPLSFNASYGGLPGNDDSGAMGAFAAFCMMGLFPNPGQNVYLISPPFFESVSIKSSVTNKTATVRNVNFDASYKNIYIQSAKLNGEVYTKNWIGHGFFLEGGTLEFVLGETESEWGTKKEDLPPSLSDGRGEMIKQGELFGV